MPIEHLCAFNDSRHAAVAGECPSSKGSLFSWPEERRQFLDNVALSLKRAVDEVQLVADILDLVDEGNLPGDLAQLRPFFRLELIAELSKASILLVGL